jgi:large subunit ribosomal protein L23
MILLKPLMTEKAVRMIETENKLTFVVIRNASRDKIKKEFESTFDSKVKSINTQINKNRKIAFIKMKDENAAINVATKLGVM